MGRLLRLLGVLTLLVGVGGTIVSFAAPFLNLGGLFENPIADVVTSAIEGPQAEDLCEEGEDIVQIGGAETYSPSLGYGREVTIFCEDAEGNRRDVTEQFAGDMIGQGFGAIPGFLGTIGISVCFTSLIGLGLVLYIVGAIISRRQTTVITGMPGVQVMNMRPDQMGYSRGTRVDAPNAGDLTAKLRQLEEARSKNLISEDEYERMRKVILDSMS